MNIEQIPDILQRGPPATDDQITQLGRVLGQTLPPEYLDLLRTANGIDADLVCFYATEEVPERTETYQVAKYAPGYLLIGTANDFPLLMRAGAGSVVYENDWGALTEECMREVAPSLAGWVEAGCPLPE